MQTPPATINILGQDFPLKELVSSNSSHCYPFVIVNGQGVISVECSDGQLHPDSVKRAETAVESFLNNDGLYSQLPDEAFTCETTLGDSILKRNDLTMSTYQYFGSKHMVLESSTTQDTYVNFCIWDRDLCEKVYNALRNGKCDSSDRPYPSFVEFFDYNEC